MIDRRLLHLTLVAASLAAAARPTAAAPLREHWGPYRLQVLADGAEVPTFVHRGETYVLGHRGERYTLRVSNDSARRIEVVASVDGRDVIDGATADFRTKRGYVVPAWGSVTIDGWRVSRGEAAAFRFSSVAGSYAALTGSARDVGVIGVAVFPERAVPVPIASWQQPARPREEARERGAGSRDGRADSPAPAPEPEASSAEGPGGPRGEADANATSAGVPGEAQKSAADGAAARRDVPATHRRPGLGTEFGEAVSSPIEVVEFVRASATRPVALLGARYDDADGLRALGIDVDGRFLGEADLRRSADPFPGERGYAAPPPGWRRDPDPR